VFPKVGPGGIPCFVLSDEPRPQLALEFVEIVSVMELPEPQKVTVLSSRIDAWRWNLTLAPAIPHK